MQDDNPVKMVDLDGNDIIILQAYTGAHNFGHTALLVQVHDGPNKGKWMYISRNGTTLAGIKPGGIGGDSVTGVNHIQYFESPEEFFKNQQNQVVAYNNKGARGKETTEYVSKDGKIRYEQGLRIATSAEEDKTIRNTAIRLEKDQYKLERDNCNDLVDDSIDDCIITSDIIHPNNWFEEMKWIYNGWKGSNVYNGNDNYDDSKK